MINQKLSSYLESYFDESFADVPSAWEHVDAQDLAYRLESRGYCFEPYFEYSQALACPINKRNEKYCYCTCCKSHSFCMLLRKEGYVHGTD